MKIVVLYGSDRHGTTRRLTELFLAEIGAAEVTEYSFPHDLDTACLGCTRCILHADCTCPHADCTCPHSGQVEPIIRSIRAADVIVAASPVYVMGMTGALKTFFDHLAYRWLVHRPDPLMFGKVGVAISTAAGPCTGKPLAAIRQQFFYWGVPKTFTWGEAVGGGWDCLKPQRQEQLRQKAVKLAGAVTARLGRVRPGVKLRAVFGVLAFTQRHGLNPMKVEQEYWLEQGWTHGKRPWN